MKKQTTAIILTAAMGISLLTGCGKQETAPDTAAPDTDTAAETPAPEEEVSEEAASGEAVTLEFQQWWEPELPDGVLAEICQNFTDETGINIELLSNPYADTKTQIAAGASTGTMADVVGLDGAWVYDFGQQGAILNLSELMEADGYDSSVISNPTYYNGDIYSIGVVNYANPMYVNLDILEQAGVEEVPATWSEFLDACAKITENTDAAAFAIPLSTEAPNGIQNQFMTWLWGSGKSMLTEDGKPNLAGNEDLVSVLELVKTMNDNGYLSPGIMAMKEQDMVNEFENGRLAFMIDGIAHLTLIKTEAPDINFTVMNYPVMDGYDGTIGLEAASWGIGIAANSEHPQEALAFIEYLLSPEVGAKLAEQANGFPGSTEAKPDYSANDETFVKVYEMSQNSTLVNEFMGAPVAEDLMRSFNEQLVLYLDGDIENPEDVLTAAQEAWDAQY